MKEWSPVEVLNATFIQVSKKVVFADLLKDFEKGFPWIAPWDHALISFQSPFYLLPISIKTSFQNSRTNKSN